MQEVVAVLSDDELQRASEGVIIPLYYNTIERQMHCFYLLVMRLILFYRTLQCPK
jgi:hypothetical protein